MIIQWYPGHMTKAKRQMQEDIKLIDVVVELLDARAPISSRNPDIDSLAGSKARVILLNKADLADDAATKKWKTWFEKKGCFVELVNSKSGAGIRSVQDCIAKACSEKTERDRRRGILNRPVRAMVAGIPNVGKSTFINSFAGKACTKTGNKPGVTKGKQWIRLNKNVELLDTPGILWPKFEDQEVGKRLAYIASIKEEILNTWELALDLIHWMEAHYPGKIEEKYGLADGLSEGKKPEEILTEIGKRRGCLQKGGTVDEEKAAVILIDDFRNGRLGKVTLELPDEENGGGLLDEAGGN